MNNNTKTLYIVIPCYNEEAALPQTSEVMLQKLTQLRGEGKISERSRIVLIDDGSADSTWAFIVGLSERHTEYVGLRLSRNRGTQNAIMAGHDYALAHDADAVITTDADLQDDVSAIDRMVDELNNGADVVYGVRSKRAKDSFAKRYTAERFYKVMDWLGAGTVNNHSDFRALSRRALTALAEYSERDMFIRGIVPMLGFNTAVVEYERSERNAGETKYTAGSLMKLAITGATSLSVKPLRMISVVGIAMLAFAVITFVAALLGVIVRGYPMLNWKIITTTIWFVGGIITLALGVVGEYVGRAFSEAKNRPRYHIFETCENATSEATGAGNK